MSQTARELIAHLPPQALKDVLYNDAAGKDFKEAAEKLIHEHEAAKAAEPKSEHPALSASVTTETLHAPLVSVDVPAVEHDSEVDH